MHAPLSIPPRHQIVSSVQRKTTLEGKSDSAPEEQPSLESSEIELSEIITASGVSQAPSSEPTPVVTDDAVVDVQQSQAPQEILIPDVPPLRFDEVVDNSRLSLDEVIRSVYLSYPKLEAALFQRNITQGEHLSATGAFDTKVKGASENGPLGFYETYRQSIGINQPTFGGGEVFAGYRIGRGEFEPWYRERETNGGGEFKVGAAVPLARNRGIDQRRADMWKAGLEMQLTEPDIQAQLIGFVQEASYAYWDWVAAGQKVRVARRVLELAEGRTERVRRQVEVELIDPPELTDNLRLIAERKAKVADAERKFRQKAVKLSLYSRDEFGRPVVPLSAQVPDFPLATPVIAEQLESDIQIALQSRPEVQVLDFQRRQYEIDYSQATNGMLPELDAVFQGKQDVGEPTSKKRDKSQFELEASLFLEVPIQRRKARGKMQAVQGKLAQLSAKRRLAEDYIVVDVQQAFAALIGAYEQTVQTAEAVKLAEDLAERERTNQREGLSDLLKVTLREQYSVESSNKQIDAYLLYYQAQADYRAALAMDRQ